MQILLIIWIAAMVQWQYFIIYFFIQGTKFLSPSMKSVVENFACANSIDHLDFRLFIFGSHSQNQDEFTVSFILRRKFIFLFFEEAARILSLCEFSWSFGLQPWCSGSILLSIFLFKEPKFSPHQWRQLAELALVLIPLTIWISDCLFVAHIVKIRMNSLSVLFRDESSSSYFLRKLFEF